MILDATESTVGLTDSRGSYIGKYANTPFGRGIWINLRGIKCLELFG